MSEFGGILLFLFVHLSGVRLQPLRSDFKGRVEPESFPVRQSSQYLSLRGARWLLFFILHAVYFINPAKSRQRNERSSRDLRRKSADGETSQCSLGSPPPRSISYNKRKLQRGRRRRRRGRQPEPRINRAPPFGTRHATLLIDGPADAVRPARL